MAEALAIRQYFFIFILFFLAFLSTKFSGLFLLTGDNVVLFCPPNAILFSALILLGKKNRLKYFILIIPGLVVSELYAGYSLLSALLFTMANSVELIFTIITFTKLKNLKYGFKSFHNFLIVSSIIIIGSIIGGAIGAMLHLGDDYLITWVKWSLGDLVAFFVITPFILTIPEWSKWLKTVGAKCIIEFSVLFSPLFLFLFALIGFKSIDISYFHGLEILIAGFICVSAVRFGIKGATLATLIMTLIILLMHTNGQGIFQEIISINSTIMMQSIILLFTFLTLSLAILIEERDRAFLRLELTNQKLEATVRKRSLDLIVRTEQLAKAQKMDTLGRLTAGIAHDFNNLLAVILWNVELFELNNPSDTEREEHIAIKKAITSGTMMTQRLVASSSKAVSAVQSTDIDTRIEDKTDVFIRLLGETINLYYEAESAIWPALVDANRFDDAMYNLVANAKDAMPDGGDVYITAKNIVINAETAAEFGDISAGEFVLITVSDTGSGIPPDLITTVFDPFYTTKQFGESHGLGLSMVYGFAKQSHGHVLMESEINVSTVVKLYLPQAVVPIPNTHKVETKVDTPSLFKGSRILVVEDDLDILNACHRALEMHGFEVITALTGRDAMARLAEGKPFDLLFSDVVLPGDMSGIDVQREALLIQPNMKSILTTGYAELDDLGEQKFTTSANLLHKPYTYRELLDRITIALTLE